MKLFHTATVVALVSIGMNAGIANAQTTEKGPYYPSPSWDQKLQCKTQTCARFIVLSNWQSKAVLDRETGLVWEQSPLTTPVSTLPIAQRVCLQSTLGNRQGWRLPTIQELGSLVDPSQGALNQGAGPELALPIGHPFIGVQPELYWSSTNAAVSSEHVWGMTFRTGSFGQILKGGTKHVLCVRGGSGSDVQ